MYLSRTGNPADLLLLLLHTVLWAGGGILIAGAVFRARRTEYWLIGIASGLLLFIVSANLLVRYIDPLYGFWLAAGLVLAIGFTVTATSGWRPQKPQRGDLLLAGGVIVIFGITASVNRGLAIFDDYHNLPLVSVMATGDIPPHFYLNPAQPLAYHYGLHVLSASMVEVGSLFPWSAFDLGKAMMVALAIGLMFLWLRRVSKRTWLVLFGATAFAFMSGTRWILLLVPAAWTKDVSGEIALLGSAAQTASTLFESLSRAWNIEGGGPTVIPFAYLSGIISPTVFSLGGSGALPLVTLVILLMIFRTLRGTLSWVIFAVFVSSLALTSEIMFLAVIGALIGAVAIWWLYGRPHGWRPPPIREVGIVILVASTMGLLQGGTLTELARSVVQPNACVAGAGHGCIGFSLLWPPAVISAHLGNLQIHRPNQLLVALLEIGPVIILAPFAVIWSWRGLRRGDALRGGLVAASLGLAAASLVLRYSVERDTARLLGDAAVLWLIIGLPAALIVIGEGRKLWADVLRAALVLGIVGGLITYAALLPATTKPSFSYFVEDVDDQFSQIYWNQLDESTQVFDRLPFRAVTLFGRSTHSNLSLFRTSPEWQSLLSQSEPRVMFADGYDYVYVDEIWWNGMTLDQQRAFLEGCADLVHQNSDSLGRSRRLFDLRGCAE